MEATEYVRRTLAVRATVTEAGELEFVASTDTVDSYQDIIEQQDWDFSLYQRNPLFLWNHETDRLPIGRGVRWAVEMVNGRAALKVTVRFDTGDPFAQEVRRKYEQGFLAACSVGMFITERQYRWQLAPEDPCFAERGCIYRRPKLVELSACTLPANGDALALSARVEDLLQRTQRLEEMQTTPNHPTQPSNPSPPNPSFDSWWSRP